MQSLLSLCALKVASDHSSFQRALGLLPRELYPALFRAAFLGKKTLVLRELVQRWPSPLLSLPRLLHCEHPPPAPPQLHSRASIQTVILGVMAHLSDALRQDPGATTLHRKSRLRLVDMTGMHDDGLEEGPDAMSLWSRTVTLAKACIDLSKRFSEDAAQATKRRRGPDAAPLPSPSSLYVEVRADLFVNSTSFSILREALAVSGRGPLRLQCRDLRAEELSLQSTSQLLKLLSPAEVRQIDLRFNNLGLEGLNALLPSMGRFPRLQSLKLPYSNIDIRRLTPAMEAALQTFSVLIGRLTALKELNLGSSRLSGRLLQLLRGLEKPLESLELAFCYLERADLYGLSDSIHASCLKKLDLSGNNLSDLLLPPFLHLLSAVSPSLLHLDIMECKLSDAILSRILPTLCRCPRLRYLGLFCNPLSSQGLKTLLQSSLDLRELQLVVYPYPVDCYDDDLNWMLSSPSWLDSAMDQEKLARFAAELQEMLEREQRTDVRWTTDMCLHRSLYYFNL